MVRVTRAFLAPITHLPIVVCFFPATARQRLNTAWSRCNVIWLCLLQSGLAGVIELSLKVGMGNLRKLELNSVTEIHSCGGC